ncbi:MAG: copper amine oxidase N-terminal domain-containing protein [Oscillospiraceae bacterium]|nr:copper amine oxidase N-terminal domain-containing protein [Oscillospiraceae bacterium]
MKKRIIGSLLVVIISAIFIPVIANAQTNPYLSGFEGEYFIQMEPEGRTWMGYGLKIHEITDEYVLFDFEAPHSGHATVYTAEPATFTSPYTATAKGTTAFGDTSKKTSPISYELTFSDNVINLKIYASDGLWLNEYYTSQGTVSEPIYVTLNGSTLNFDQPPIMINNRTMVPIRAIFEALGYTLDWNGDTQTAVASNGSNTITVTVDNNIITYSGGTYECDTPPVNRNGRILVPVRAISECADCAVDWDDKTRTVIITAKAAGDTPYTAQDISALNDFIICLDMYRADKAWKSVEYDSGNPLAGDRSIFDNILGEPRCADLKLYPFDAPQENWQGNKSDPQGRFDSYIRISRDEVVWILENIFNCTEDDIIKMESNRLSSDENIYLHDGYYYMFIGGVGWTNETTVTNIDYDGEYFNVSYDSAGFMSVPEHFYAVLKLKEIDGKKYWSLYKHSKDPSIFND